MLQLLRLLGMLLPLQLLLHLLGLLFPLLQLLLSSDLQLVWLLWLLHLHRSSMATPQSALKLNFACSPKHPDSG
eukprot:COSAG01_NODE_28048_length_670_cov_1.753065_1_plen_73_part_01